MCVTLNLNLTVLLATVYVRMLSFQLFISEASFNSLIISEACILSSGRNYKKGRNMTIISACTLATYVYRIAQNFDSGKV